MKKIILISFMAFLAFKVKAEYRVYQYYVSSKVFNPLEKSKYLVTSTLDPVSYLAYHGGGSTFKIDLLRTWMCKGHTGRKVICDSPFKQLGEELQAKLIPEVGE